MESVAITLSYVNCFLLNAEYNGQILELVISSYYLSITNIILIYKANSLKIVTAGKSSQMKAHSQPAETGGETRRSKIITFFLIINILFI